MHHRYDANTQILVNILQIQNPLCTSYHNYLQDVENLGLSDRYNLQNFPDSTIDLQGLMKSDLLGTSSSW